MFRVGNRTIIFLKALPNNGKAKNRVLNKKKNCGFFIHKSHSKKSSQLWVKIQTSNYENLKQQVCKIRLRWSHVTPSNELRQDPITGNIVDTVITLRNIITFYWVLRRVPLTPRTIVIPWFSIMMFAFGTSPCFCNASLRFLYIRILIVGKCTIGQLHLEIDLKKMHGQVHIGEGLEQGIQDRHVGSTLAEYNQKLIEQVI